MNLGVERFLILGCLAVVILELPHLIGDVQTASVQAQVREQMVAEKVEQLKSPEGTELAEQHVVLDAKEESLAVLDLNELLPARAGL